MHGRGPGIVSACLGLALAALLATSSPTLGQSASDKDSDGPFTGLAIITDDLKWYKLFESPKTPVLSVKDVFGPNERGALALIFSNAQPRNGVVKVECDVTAFDPRGKKPIVDDGACYDGPFYGENILVPALLDLQFETSKEDPPGRAGFTVTMHDVHSGRKVKLTVAYELEAGK